MYTRRISHIYSKVSTRSDDASGTIEETHAKTIEVMKEILAKHQ